MNTANVRLMDSHLIDAAPNTEGRIQLQRECNLLLVSIEQGGLNIWLGEFTGAKPGAAHFHFGQTNAPVWVPIPKGTFTLVYLTKGPANPVLGCIHLGEMR